jgi:uncharacterized membrane protein (DUF106 family)
MNARLKIFLAAFYLQTVIELVTYLFIRRKASYKIAVTNVNAAVLSLENVKKEIDDGHQKKENSQVLKKLEKKKEIAEKELQSRQRLLSSLSSKIMPVVAVTNIMFVRTLSAKFQGVVVAQLPFVPMAPFKALLHRGVEGDDFRLVGCTGWYSMSAMVARAIVQKFFELQPKHKRLLADGNWERSQKQTEAILNVFDKDSTKDPKAAKRLKKKEGKMRMKKMK